MKLNKEKCQKMLLKDFNSFTSIAEKTGLTYVTVSKILKGTVSPRPANLKKICEALNCSPEELI